ncbi:MAG: alanine dehydrogenase [SAR202 cluster bacterium]|nr:alanine dehydrogenase [SAR202 cluster bacterium]
MIIGLPKETKDQELRVGITPDGVDTLIKSGHRVLVEQNAGVGSGIPNDSYEKVGAELIQKPEALFSASELIVKVKEFQLYECELLRPGLTSFSFLSLGANPKLAEALLKSRVTAIAYETIEMTDGSLPILKPMSALTGRLAVDVATHYLKSPQGGTGKLLSNISGANPVKVVILGAGTAGFHSAELALNMGAEVTVLSRGKQRLGQLQESLNNHPKLKIATSSSNKIEEAVELADVVIGAIRDAGGSVPKIVTKSMVKSMQKGSVIIDACIDQGGCIETSRETTLSDPVYVEEGVTHYCVRNMPGAVPRTATEALVNVSLPYTKLLADKGVKDALATDTSLSIGLNVDNGRLMNPSVSKALGMS